MLKRDVKPVLGLMKAIEVKKRDIVEIRKTVAERARIQLLTAKQIPQFWAALEGAPVSEDVRTILRLALIAGQRVGEIADRNNESRFDPEPP